MLSTISLSAFLSEVAEFFTRLYEEARAAAEYEAYLERCDENERRGIPRHGYGQCKLIPLRAKYRQP